VNRWQEIKKVLAAALERSPSERAAFLDQQCAGDSFLRAEVESLLAYNRADDDAADSPAVHSEGLRPSEQPTEEVGRVIGSYKLVGELGHGGMGAVYLAARADEHYRQDVAIKLIRRGMDTDFVLRRFRNERQILAGLDHPNIARLLDGGSTEDGLPYLVMEYVAGLPIDAFCNEHALDIERRLRLFQEACAAIHYAHQRQVIHRDIKPSNILVSEDGCLKLLDFGIAKLLTPELAAQTLDPTLPAVRLMTPAYASPEQIKGEPVTAATDVYSLGVLLYEMLTGHKPYRVKSQAAHDITQAVLEEQPLKPSTAITLTAEVQSGDGSSPITVLTPESVSKPREGSPDRLRRRLRGDLDNIVLTALRKDPGRRYASVEQFSEDIRRHLEGLPVIARRDTIGYRAAKFIGRNRGGVAGVVLSVLLLGLVAMLPYLRTSRSSEQILSETRSVAVLPFRLLGNEEGDKTLSMGVTDTLVTRLGSLRSIIVRSSGAVSRVTAQGERDPVEIGRELQVDAVLEGTLQRTDNRFRINTRLLRVVDGALIWSASFDESETELFKLQDRLSIQVTESLTSELNPKQRELLTKRDTSNRDAYHSYWRGRFFLDKRSPERAVPEFQKAINLDSVYAMAYAGLADAYTMRAYTTSGIDSELYEKASALTNKALDLDPSLAEAHTSLARLKYMHDWDWEGAEESFKRALELDPNSVNAHQHYGRLLTTLGRYDEAIAEIQKAQELDPRSADLAVPLFAILEKRGEFDEALRVLQSSLEMDKASQIVQRAVGKIYLLKGDYDRVIELGNQYFPNLNESDFAWASMLATAYHRTGEEHKARRMLNHLKELAAKDSKARYFLVMHYSELGRTDEAVAALEECLELHEERMAWTKDEPRFAGIKDDPRFHKILQKLNIPN
jgi:serine/threonine protein kinase/tetratricopeptide (TPR) repeat protein